FCLPAKAPHRETSLLFRTNRPHVAPLGAGVKGKVKPPDQAQPIGRITTMDQAIASSLATRRLTMVLLGAFALLALLLASVGLYGLMALTVTQRTRELGIPMALGAERINIFKLTLRQGKSLIALATRIAV